MSERNYYFCKKCGHNHRFTSKIGKEHIKYNSQAAVVDEKNILPSIIEETEILSEEKLERPVGKNRVVKFFNDYVTSYRKGVVKFGIWWSIFQISIWSIALIFLIMAAIILIIYLPKIEMLYWELT